MEYKVVHNEAASRFETEVKGILSMVNYHKDGETLSVTHTGVPPELRNHGIAAALTKTLLEYARDNGYKVRPICPYTRAYVEKNTGYDDILA